MALGELLDDASIGVVNSVAMCSESSRSEERSQIVHIDLSCLVLQIIGRNHDLGIIVFAISSDAINVCLSTHQIVKFV